MPATLPMAALTFIMGAQGDPPQRPGAQLQWYRCSEYSACNLLYILAAAHTGFADYGAIRELQVKGNQMRTLRDLELAGAALGLDVAVRKISAADLEAIAYPVLVHVDGWNESPATGGEFLLLAGSEGSVFHVVEGITCSPTVIDRDEFFRRWTGYVLVNTHRRPWAEYGLMSVLALITVGAFSVSACGARAKRSVCT